MELTKVGEVFGQQATLAGIPGTFDELHDGAGHFMGDAAQDHAETRGAFALARPGMDDDQAFLTGFGGHDLVTGGLLFGHLGVVTGVVCDGQCDGRVGIIGQHGVPHP